MSAAASPVPLKRLRDAAVRDLAWLLSSVSLVAPSAHAPLAQPWASGADPAAAAAWLAALDAHPEPLHAALAQARPVRLGRYAECLLGYFVQHAPSLTLVAANLPLRRNGLTLGECDFLVETASGERLHWELAVKYYLCVAASGAASLASFVGPNLADRFDLKYARLIDHQLRLTTRDEFASLGHPGPWRAQMLVKGWLFYPVRGGLADGAAMTSGAAAGDAVCARPNASGRPAACASLTAFGWPAIRDPLEVEAGHPRGFWITRDEWPAFGAEQCPDARWMLLPRLAWLAPRVIDDASAACGQNALLDADAMLAQAAELPGPALVAGLVRDHDAVWRETVRGFIVPDGWPERAAAFAGR
ncbi:DUF1853 family protein [Burkholderia sp. TSV86]|uniref:DUF1853 family protein n=1 Tax=Burkholderia sp. TSV86 TaxID=1385594 RepID=UPI0007589CED|nr:DUF1853 family protein [Burkholderia sp. TSV86]KVE33832.1 hypothetical protein WS68_11810 [Burkholderia sp. TSV86]